MEVHGNAADICPGDGCGVQICSACRDGCRQVRRSCGNGCAGLMALSASPIVRACSHQPCRLAMPLLIDSENKLPARLWQMITSAQPPAHPAPTPLTATDHQPRPLNSHRMRQTGPQSRALLPRDIAPCFKIHIVSLSVLLTFLQHRKELVDLFPGDICGVSASE